MPTHSADEWKTQSQAAAILGCSEKTIARLAQRKQLQKKMRPNPGRRPTPVYYAADIERVRAEAAQVEGFPVPQSRAPEMGLQLPPAPAPAAGAALGAFIEFLAEKRPPAHAVPLRDKVFLTLDEAAAYTGLTRASITRRIKDGTLEAFKDGGWRIRRANLEQL